MKVTAVSRVPSQSRQDTGYRGIVTTHSRWQRLRVRVIRSSETGDWPFKYFWVFNRTLKKLEVIFDNSLHFKTKQNKTSQHGVTVIRILIKKFFFVFAIHECFNETKSSGTLYKTSFHLPSWNMCHWSSMRGAVFVLNYPVLLTLRVYY